MKGGGAMLKGKGFTLVEVLLVIVIIGILAAIVIPRITYSKTEAQKQACNSNVAAMNSQIELYHSQEGAYPTVLTDLVNSPTNQSYIDAIPTCPFGQNYTYNTTSHRVLAHSH